MSEQSEPIEAGHDDAVVDEKLAGLIEQLRQDVALGHVSDVEDAVQQRLTDASIDVTPEQLARIVAQVSAE